MLPERRVVAIVLPDLLCELVLARDPFGRAGLSGREGKAVPFAVVWRDEQKENGSESKAGERLAAVSRAAQRAGVHVGQRVAEAQAQLAHLAVRDIEEGEVRAALERVAEVALAFGTPVALELPDTVWVEVTGGAHLWGGEENLVEELASRVRALSHRAQIAVANGPHLARAFACWDTLDETRVVRVAASESAERLKKLPLQALPIDDERRAWFSRLGILEIGQLATMPPKALSARLGANAQRVFGLMRGYDSAPLTPFAPPRVLSEERSWDEPVSALESLLFVVRGLVSRLSARLEGRGEAAQVLCVHFSFDRAIARHRGIPPERELRFDLAAPLWRETELERVVRSRLERLELGAPTRALRITVPELTVAPAHQLDLSGAASGPALGLEELPVLLAELGADIGSERLGVLRLVDDHCPEGQSTLEAVKSTARKAKKAPQTPPNDAASGAFTRLLPEPVVLTSALGVGETLVVGTHLYSIQKLRFVQRLESVKWWTTQPTSRDYLRLWLSEKRGPAERSGHGARDAHDAKRAGQGGIEALVFIDRATGKRYLQAIVD